MAVELESYKDRTDGAEVIKSILGGIAQGGHSPNWIAAAYRLIADKLELQARSSGKLIEELGMYPSNVQCAFIREQGDRDEALIQNLREGADWLEAQFKLYDPEAAAEKVWNLPTA